MCVGLVMWSTRATERWQCMAG